MDTILCGISAFLYYRIPPSVPALCANDIDLSTPVGRRTLGSRGCLLDYLPAPVSLLASERSQCHHARGVRYRLLTASLPTGAVRELDAYHRITSPSLTLFTMALQLSRFHLVMAMYELCGTFSCVRLRPEHRAFLQDRLDAGYTLREGGWSPVLDEHGRLTDLWKRPPLTTIDELVELSDHLKGKQGHKAFERAIAEVRGVVASPFEAQAAMRLCGSHYFGGSEFGPVALNHPLVLDAPARLALGQRRVIVDQLYESDGERPSLALECQGRVVHGVDGATDRDVNRLLALQHMGVDVIMLLPEQIRDAARFRHLERLLERKLGMPHRERNEAQARWERELVHDLFIDWADLGLQP